MNLLKKLFKSQAFQLKQDWIVAEGTQNGKLILIRFYSGAREAVGSSKFPFRIGIAIPVYNTQSNGMPTSEENKKLFAVEDIIINYFNNSKIGILCIVLTFPKVKEYVIYSSTARLSALMNKLKNSFPEYEIQSYVKEDKNWNTYRYYDPKYKDE